MEYWQQQEILGRIRKSIRNKLSLLGKRVKRMGEEGTIVVCSPEWNGRNPEYFIEFKENDCEQLLGLPFQIWDDDKGRFVDDRDDILFDLTDEEKEYLNIGDDYFILKKI